MFRFVTTIPKDILKSMKQVKKFPKNKPPTNHKPTVSLENKMKVKLERFKMKFNYYKIKFNDFMNMEVENNLYKY